MLPQKHHPNNHGSIARKERLMNRRYLVVPAVLAGLFAVATESASNSNRPDTDSRPSARQSFLIDLPRRAFPLETGNSYNVLP